MLLKSLNWLLKNLRTLFLSFLLALLVWVSSVTAADPNEERQFRFVPLEVVGQGADVLIVSEAPPTTITVSLYAPRSLLNRYEANPTELLRAWVDLSGMEYGEFEVPLQISYQLAPTKLVSVEPERLSLSLDRLVAQTYPVRLDVTGRPARGYQAEIPLLDTTEVTVSGPSALVAQVAEVRASLDIADADETIQTFLNLIPLNESGQRVQGVTLTPLSVQVEQPVTLLGGYRNVVVRVITSGPVADGYRLTNISVSPPSVIVFSSDPELVNALPGYVETEALDLTGATDDLDLRVALALPEGISVVGEQSVLVRVSIAAIESSLPLSVPVEVLGLAPGLAARVSPNLVDVLLSGPVLELDGLQIEDVRVFVDLTDLTEGVHQLTLQVEILAGRVRLVSLLPETVEVTIAPQPTSTPTPPGGSGIQTPTPTATRRP